MLSLGAFPINRKTQMLVDWMKVHKGLDEGINPLKRT
jgi:hypothetical protein